MKKLLSIICVIIIIFSSAVLGVISASSYNLSLLKSCKKLFTYNGKSSSYVYGYTSDTLYSAKVLPSVNDIRYVSVDGLIRAVCHNETCAYALYEDKFKNRYYYIVQMNMIDGSCKYYSLGNEPALKNTSVAVSDNEVFIINTDGQYAYAKGIDLNGEKENTYQFDGVVSEVFINNSKAYARLYNGEIYYISNGKYQYATSINTVDSLSNAGTGWIYTDYKSLVSLTDKNQQQIYSADSNRIVNNSCVIYSDGRRIKTSDGKYYNMSYDIIALLSTDNKIAVVLSDYSCKVISKTEMKSDNGSSVNNYITNNGSSYYVNDNIIYGVESGTTVSQFKKAFSSTINVYDSDGNSVTSEKMKTGYITEISGNRYFVAVRGDVTGEGNVKSNDITVLMSVLVDKSKISGVFYISADYNYNGKVNNQDLVLIAQDY